MSKALQKVQASGHDVARKKRDHELYRTLEGLEWSSGHSVIRGAQFSDATRWALAAFCNTTGANPLTHVDILGGKPFLNATFWAERLSTSPHHVSHKQINIGKEVEADYRALGDAAQQRGDVKGALAYHGKADEVAALRIEFGPPGGAVAAYVTIIRRFIPSAPLAAIEAGKVENIDQYIVEVREANWVGGSQYMTKAGLKPKQDPVGMADPEKTARTRSFRRAATKAYSAWLGQFEHQVAQAEQAVEAEWQEIVADKVEVEPVEAEVEVVVEFDRNTARKRFFASMKGAGIPEDERKQWAADRGFPPSTTEWTQEDFERAQAEMTEPLDAELRQLCEDLGENLEEISLKVLGMSTPEYTSHYTALITALRARGEGEEL